jgi:hypothetical protein
MTMLTWRKLALLFLIGAPLASMGDLFHVHTKTTFYPPEGHVFFIKGVPFWIPFIFGIAAGFLGIMYLMTKSLLGAKRFRQGSNVTEVIVAGLVYSLLHISSGYISHWSFPFPDVALALPVILAWYLLDRSSGGALACIIAAFIGVSAEIFLVHMGIFLFSDKANQLFGVATWLGWVYMAGALAIGRFVERRRPYEACET